MSKHTPEPWEARRDPCHFHTLSSIYGHTHNRSVAEIGGETFDEQADNTARIVACVNALAGVDDPAAFMAKVREIVELERTTSPADPDAAAELTTAVYLLSTMLPIGGAQ